jgi:nucleoside-diphosphate-sugar epimerase
MNDIKDKASCIFITGSTGFLGRRFVRALADNGADRILLLIRERGGESPAQRLAALGLNLPGVEAVSGDISDPAVIEQLVDLGGVDEFWHIAGLTDFHESKRPMLEQVNIEGTRHALTLAERWGVRKFFHIGTAYVAGICDGPVLEDGLLPDPVFRNPYEETKYRGEELVRASRVPWLVIRPSILLGDSRTGESNSDKMAYGVCKIYHSVARWLRREERDGDLGSDRRYRVVGRAETAKNCVCVDDALELMLTLRGHGEVGRTYHCCHPNSPPLGWIHDAMAGAASAPFLYLSDDGAAINDRKQRFVDKGCRTYEPYMLNSDPPFDLTNTRRVASRRTSRVRT